MTDSLELIPFPDGKRIQEKGLKLYPSGVMTTWNDEIFPGLTYTLKEMETIANAGFYWDKTNQSVGNDILDDLTLPDGFIAQADGSLYYRALDLTCYPNGFVATSDGWIISEDKYSF